MPTLITLSLALFFGSIGTASAQSTWELTTRAWESTEYYDLLVGFVRQDLQEWIEDPIVIYAIREQNDRNRDLTDRQIERLDRRWQAEGSYSAMVGDLLGRQASVILRERRELSQGVINQIIVTDARGLNVAISSRTLDFFQGDEPMWSETVPIGPEAVYVSDIGWDQAMRRNQSLVSLSVTDPDSNDVIGAVTFGIDVVNAMRKRDLVENVIE
ncbi:MAG: hypothetical protein AAGF44_08905 [Pseudomonadota bacterium]